METSKTIAYLPFIQQVTKYAFFFLCLLIFAPRIITLLDATEARLAEGSAVSIGLDGIQLGEAPKMPVTKSVDPSVNLGRLGGGAPVKGHGNLTVVPLEDVYHLVHGAAKDKMDYIVKVSLDALDPSYLDRVDKVVYHLHDSFENDVREVTDRSSGFSMTFGAWGQFEVKADVYVRDRREPVRLKRWLNF